MEAVIAGWGGLLPQAASLTTSEPTSSREAS
jgi:hypothetical protein